MDRQTAAPTHLAGGAVEDMDASNLRFLQDRRIIRAADAPRIITSTEDLTIADNVEAIKAASYVIFRATSLILRRVWLIIAAWFAVEQTRTRRRQWVSACASAMVGAAINSVGVLIFLKLLS